MVVCAASHCVSLARRPCTPGRVTLRLPRSASARGCHFPATHRAEPSQGNTTTRRDRSLAAGAGAEPWHIGYQCNERYLKWDDSAQRQLLRLAVKERLFLDDKELGERLELLARLLPDLVGKMEKLKVDTLVALLKNPPDIAQRLVSLREALPNDVNVSKMISARPTILLTADEQEMKEQVALIRDALGADADLGVLLEAEPMFLQADIRAVLDRLGRLLPAGMDPVQYVLSNPRAVLDMEECGMPSSNDKGVV